MENGKSGNSKRNGDPTNKVSLDMLLNYAGLGKFHIPVFIIGCGGYFAFCCEIMLYMFLSAKLPHLWNLSNLQFAILPASSGIVNIIGGWTVGGLSDFLGRKWPFTVCTTLIAAFGLGSSFAQSFWVFLSVRAFVSFGIGGSCTCVFPFLLEYLPVSNRGKAMTSMTFCGALGACFAGGFAWWLIPTYPDNGWRYLTIACAVPNIFIIAVMLFFPYDTPQYLLHARKEDKLKRVIRTLLWCNGKKFHSDFGMDFDSVRIVRNIQQLDVEKEEMSIEVKGRCCRFWDVGPLRALRLFGRPHTFKTIVITILWLCLATGYWGSSLFIPQYFLKIGVDPYFTIFVSFVAELPGIALLSIIIDWPRVGRINTIRAYSFLTAIFMIVFTFVRNLIVTSVFSVFVYFSMVPLYAVMYTYVPEAYPTQLRSTVVGYSVFASSIPNIVTPFLSGYLAANTIVWLYPLVWSCVFGVMFLTSLCLRHKTVGRNLD